VGKQVITVIASIVIVALLVQAYPQAHPGVIVQSQEEFVIEVLHITKSNPTRNDDLATWVCEDNGMVYLVGLINFTRGDFQTATRGRVEAWLNGVELKGHINIDGQPGGCAVFSSHLVIPFTNITFIGFLADLKAKLMVSKLDLSNYTIRDLEWVQGDPNSAITDGEYLYVGGIENRPQEITARVDKFDRDFNRVAMYRSKVEPEYVILPNKLGLEPTKGYLWIVGVMINFSSSPPTLRWFIDIVDPRDMSPVKSLTLDVEGSATSITFDGEGNAYVVGPARLQTNSAGGAVAKLSSDGSILKVARFNNTIIIGVAYTQGYLVAVGWEEYGGYERSAIYVLDRDLNMLVKRHLDEGAYNSHAYGILLVGDVAYIAGDDEEPGDSQWVLYVVRLQPPPPPPPTPVPPAVTVTETVTVTRTTTVTQTTTATTTIVRLVTVTLTQTTTTTTTEVRTLTQTIERTIAQTVTTLQYLTTTVREVVRETLRVTETRTEATTVREVQTLTSTVTSFETVKEEALRADITIAAFIAGLLIALVVSRLLLRRS
jgi:hypothetical protein